MPIKHPVTRRIKAYKPNPANPPRVAVRLRCIASTIPRDVGTEFTVEMHVDPVHGITYRNVRRVEYTEIEPEEVK